MKCKVLFLIDKLDPGGSQRHLVRLARKLPDSGIEVGVCCIGHLGTWGEELKESGVEIFELGCESILPPQGLKALSRLREILKNHKPDILHCLLFDACILGPLAAWKIGFPCRVISSARDTCFWMKKRHMLALGFATRFADRVCCNSIAVAEALKRVKADAGKEISIIPNGIEILPVSDTRGLRDSLGISPDEFVFICVSRLRREKGHATLLDAAAKLKDYDKELKILMAGDGPEQKNLERQAERLGITGMLKFCGHRDDVRELLAIADAAIFLSENEGFSNAVLEAMAAAKAVIATDIEGNSETIENGVDGLLVPAGNPEATAAAMNKMMDDGTLREALGNRAKEKVKSEFSVRREIDSYLEIYERLSGKSKGAEK